MSVIFYYDPFYEQFTGLEYQVYVAISTAQVEDIQMFRK